MSIPNKQNNLLTKETYIESKMNKNYSYTSSFKNKKEKIKSRNNIILYSYKFLTLLFLCFSYILLQIMMQQKNKITSELNLVKNNYRIMYEGDELPNKKESKGNIVLKFLDDEGKNEDENQDENENENEDEDEDEDDDEEFEPYKKLVDLWRQRSTDFTEMILTMWYQWNCGRKTRDMDEDWKGKKFNEWRDKFSLELISDDKKCLDDVTKMVKDKVPVEAVQLYCNHKKELWETRKDQILKEWKIFIHNSLQDWVEEKHRRNNIVYYDDDDDDDDDNQGAEIYA
ncbi:Plasmodium exported protein, unknown function [Plasmodium gallinaceum]|uniref:Plasmodium RESA N-terminal domain-containing protein n=1 Tax=Plasmodium gallinaceum TaxID=5849 RepID=A0A1J1GRZ8_PLAGA|nr:Plasmodium exported protein, unknown function [Plasmodium gallinaceum]CRG95247.1 Plasmodium exported protein, unknown function [Plasmodium gallinaceum]